MGVEVFNEVMLFMNERERACIYADVLFFPVFVMTCCIALQVAIFAWFGRAFFLLDIITYNYTCAFSRETYLYIYFIKPTNTLHTCVAAIVL